jgi:predicted transcriptional regulator
MSKSVSLKFDDDMLREVDEAALEMHIPRETFVRQAVRSYVRRMAKRRLRTQLRNESALTAEESLKVLHEFEAIS